MCQRTVPHNKQLIAHRYQLFKAVLNDDDRQRKIAVELFECTEKVGGSNGIKL